MKIKGKGMNNGELFCNSSEEGCCQARKTLFVKSMMESERRRERRTGKVKIKISSYDGTVTIFISMCDINS
jgi:hypothetical protein